MDTSWGDFDPVRCGRHEETLRNLAGWQKSQNGTLERLATSIASQEERFNRRVEQLRADLRDDIGAAVEPVTQRVSALEEEVRTTSRTSRANLWGVAIAAVMALLNVVVSLVLKAG